MALLKELTFDLLEEDKDLLKQLISAISNWKNDLISPQQVIGQARSEKSITLPSVIAAMNFI